MSSKLGFKRMKKATPEALLERAKEIEKKILDGEFKGQKLKSAKKFHAFYMWKYRSAVGADKKAAHKVAQMIFPEMLRHIGITPIDDLFIKRALQESIALAKKAKNKKKARKAS